MRVDLMGTEIDSMPFENALEKGLELMRAEKLSQVVTINPEMFDEIKKNPEFKKIIDEAELVIPDGIGVKIGLMLTGKNASRIAGIDFAKRLLAECAKNNYPVAIIGSKEEVITKAVENLNNEISGLNIVYYHNGYFDDDTEIIENLKNVNPKLILAALGSPKQEFFIYKLKNILNSALAVGIGGSLDVWSGNVKRAPKIFQKLGLEWLYRTVTQPERFKRIFPTLPMFLIKVITYKKES